MIIAYLINLSESVTRNTHEKKCVGSGDYAGKDTCDPVTLVGFGTFKKVRRKARTGRNHQTGESVKIKAHNVVTFKPGQKLKSAV